MFFNLKKKIIISLHVHAIKASLFKSMPLINNGRQNPFKLKLITLVLVPAFNR